MTDNVNDMEDPFAVAVDEDDPFATSEDFKGGGGNFAPRPSSIEDLADLLIVILPRVFEKEAKVSEFLQEKYNMAPTREQWTADVIVIDGPKEWKFSYRGRKDRDSEYEDMEQIVTEYPYEMLGYRVTAGNLLGALNKIHGGAKPMGIGRIRAGYTAAEMRKGKTFEEFAKERAAWEARVQKDGIRKAGDEPKPRWHFDPSDAPEDRAKALAWWKQARAAGFTI